MAENPDLRGPLALGLLRLFPDSVRQDVLADFSFQEKQGLKADSTASFDWLGISFKGSTLLEALRTLINGSDDVILVKPIDGDPLELSIERGRKPKLFLTVEENRRQLPSFWMLSEDKEVRLASFSEDVETANLPAAVIATWKERLEAGPLTEGEMDELKQCLALVPQTVAERIRDELEQADGRVDVLVPRELEYYRFLIGERGDASNVEEYARGYLKQHIERLLRWDFRQGLAQCLLFCASSTLSALVDITNRSAPEVEEFFTWLSEHGDSFSQVAGIEVGIRSLQHFSGLEPVLVRMIERIRDEDPDSRTSRVALTVNLLVFADGEMSRVGIFRKDPPFWRRMAAVAQASIIERELLAAGGGDEDSSSWLSHRAEYFFMQSLADLRQQPRCIPELISAMQLRLDFLMRARIVGHNAADGLPEGPLRDLLLGSGEGSLETHTAFPTASAPGPIEGGVEGGAVAPDAVVQKLRELDGDKALDIQAFTGVVNFCLAYRFDEEVAAMIVSLLKKVQYRVNLRPDPDVGFALMMSLAIIAASIRHPALANEVRILTRVLRRRGDIVASADDQMRIALIACASRPDLADWCKAVGEWLIEISNGEMSRNEALAARSHLHILCHAVPELWPHVAKADAALAAISY